MASSPALAPDGVSRALVIANPRAGQGRTARELSHLLLAVREAACGVDVALTEAPGHARRLATAAVADRRPLAPGPAGLKPRAGFFPLDVDGDALGDVPLSVEVVRRALRVRAPSG